VLPGVGAQKEQRVRPIRIAAAGGATAVGSDDEHRRWVGEKRRVTGRELRPRGDRETFVRLVDAARKRAVAECTPDGEEDEEADEREAGPEAPAPPPTRCVRRP